MKRKIIQLAGTTFVVSLPLPWIRANHVVKGDEVELEVKEGSVTLFTQAKREAVVETVTIDVSGQSRRVMQKMVAATYKAGYDEVLIKYKTTVELEQLHAYLNGGLIGFEITEEKIDFMRVKSISIIDEKEFTTMLRREFMFVLSIADDLVIALREKNMEELKRISLRDATVNRLADYCRRMINKTQILGFKRNNAVYYIVEEWERIADLYAQLIIYLLNSKRKVSAQEILLLEEINAYLRSFYELFYTFEFKSLNRFMEKKVKMTIAFGKNDYFYFLLQELVEKIYNLNGPLMVEKI